MERGKEKERREKKTKLGGKSILYIVVTTYLSEIVLNQSNYIYKKNNY